MSWDLKAAIGMYLQFVYFPQGGHRPTKIETWQAKGGKGGEWEECIIWGGDRDPGDV